MPDKYAPGERSAAIMAFVEAHPGCFVGEAVEASMLRSFSDADADDMASFSAVARLVKTGRLRRVPHPRYRSSDRLYVTD